MEVVVVLVTVRRGWSGGTEGNSRKRLEQEGFKDKNLALKKMITCHSFVFLPML